MMKEEFEALAGYEVSDNDYYDIIEPMYMAANLSKAEFVNTINKKRFALTSVEQMMAEIKKIAKHLKETCDLYTDSEATDKLNALAEQLKERINAKGFLINTRYTFEHLGECRGCSYPSSIDFYDNRYHTIKEVSIK